MRPRPFPASLEHRVEARRGQNLRGSEPEDAGDCAHAAVGYFALDRLHEEHERQHGGASVRVAGHDRVRLPVELL